MKRFLIALLVGLATLAWAGETSALAAPALWRIVGEPGTVVLLGSVHVLPAEASWRTPAIADALRRADVVVFEIPTDATTQQKIAQEMAARGRLPNGQSLRAQLSPDGQKTFDRVLGTLGLPLAAVDGLQPWFAGLLLDEELLKRVHQTSPGPDFLLAAEAQQAGKEIRYLETTEQQLALLAPQDETVALENFEADLKDAENAETEIASLTEAWLNGDVAAIAAQTEQEFSDAPQARAFFFDDRNRAWADKIVAMTREKKSFLIVVGAGHLVGKMGVPALLRARGLRVVGP